MKLLFSTSLLSFLALTFFLSSCGSDVEPLCTEFTWYADEDGDGFGDTTNPIKNCDSIPPSGFAEMSGDLDDTQSGITTVSNREKFDQLMAGICNKDIAVLQYVHPTNFVQHNHRIGDGKAGLEQFILDIPDTTTISIKRIYTDSDGDIYIAHSVYGRDWNGGTPQVVFDVYRFENGSIVEHWDNITDEVDDGNFFNQTNGPKLVNPSERIKTDDNRSLVKAMANNLFLSGMNEDYFVYFDTIREYYQHSVGSDPLVSEFKSLLDDLPEGDGLYTSIEFVYAEGDFALVMSEGPDIKNPSDPKKYAYFDLFRLFNNRISEHWEVKEVIPTTGMANNNGKW